MSQKDILALQVVETIKKYGIHEQNLFDELTAIINDFHSNNSNEAKNSDIKKKIDLFLISKKIDGLSEKTLADYKLQLFAFANRINIPVSKITTDDIRMYISFLTENKSLKDTTLLTYINTLKSFFSWLVLEEIIKKNPCLKIKSIKVDKKRSRKALSAEDLERLRNACITLREKAIVEFLYSTGCRLSEVLNIEIDAINFDTRSVKVIGKGDKERTVYFSIKAKLFLADYLKQRKGECKYLFSGSIAPYNQLKPRAVQQELQAIGERAELKYRVHPHLMRHTFASNALKAGMDITIIQRLLGHSNVGTTQIYAEVSQEMIIQEYNKIIA